ncbi:3-hydroxyacyl-ACP dehydratase FabZ family protein [Salinimicrobium oceani]|uniref:Hydroxymyristoyl-ACP dehydratase n=1 Tax=Salinimicrobium oceani TaxID=2722702 RepID=A0ABX1CYM1_9FLAO|nr:hydroxymyristoyl-ACP dehydratase [Salinimicrobium oceani]NJW53367.1 hydroxymyristoyl-ACP dehydratase [Salinimicrobium oceani]
MEKEQILELLPYSEPFRFVDSLENVSENGIFGTYTFQEDAFFYKGHFKNKPVTPGVILTECMAQIGVVCLGIFLLKEKVSEDLQVALSNASVDYYLPVFPGEKVKVSSEKIYFRFNKLKCKVKMFNAEDKLVCKGEISGMIKAG